MAGMLVTGNMMQQGLCTCMVGNSCGAWMRECASGREEEDKGVAVGPSLQSTFCKERLAKDLLDCRKGGNPRISHQMPHLYLIFHDLLSFAC